MKTASIASSISEEPSSVRRLKSVTRAKRAPSPRKPLGVVAQVKEAAKPKARLAALLGALLGAFVPLASFVLAHNERAIGKQLWEQDSFLLLLGGLAYSAPTVYAWGKLAFGSTFKAGGFVLLLEGVMVGAKTEWLGLAALVYLIGINAIATGCTLSLAGRKAT